jgi:hypothetical protein
MKATPSASPGPKPRRDLQGYIDETGLLRTTDPLFGLGLLISPNINELHRRIINFRNRTNYHKEFKFTNVGTHNVLYFQGLIDEFFDVPHSVFSAAVFEKKNMDIQKFFKGNHDKAYNSFCGKIIAETLPLMGDSFSDYVTILADDVSTSKTNNFEKEIKTKIKRVTRRNAISSIIRLESHAVTEIQLVDVLIGTVAYAFKIEQGLVKPDKAKLQLVKHLQKKLRVPVLSIDMERRVKKGIKFKITKVIFK